jgi:HEPN domain-containing protein
MSARQNLNPEQWSEVVRWLDRADDDLHLVELIMRGPSPLLRPAALHCQQAVEKIAKAALVAFSIRPPKTHDVGKLGKLAASQHTEIGNDIQALAGLTAWYISVRYPDSELELTPSSEEILETVEGLRALRAKVQALAPSDKV